jgi:Cytochrome oxidase complex assembly protein 1
MEPTNPAGAQPVMPRPGWWSRNWKWFIPAGCLTMIVLSVAFFACIVLIVFGALKSTDVYKTAVARAKANPAVVEALGTPIKEGWYLSGKTNVEGPTGTADISIPISGPKGKGTIYATATKSAGRWNYTTLEVEIAKTSERIPLQDTTESD